MQSISEVQAWLKTYGQQFAQKLRIITNRYRKIDGGDCAAENLIKYTAFFDFEFNI
jgi:hypothetical protein